MTSFAQMRASAAESCGSAYPEAMDTEQIALAAMWISVASRCSNLRIFWDLPYLNSMWTNKQIETICFIKTISTLGKEWNVSANVKNAVSRSLTATSLKSIGTNAMAGLKAGITAGRSGVVSAMQSAARAAVNAAKKELKIASPSKVFRDEVGSMTMKGFGEGVLKESRVQARTIRNAARFLTGEAKEGAIAFGNNDNRKTYNQTSSVNLSGNNFYVRDEQDIRSLAIEIATLTKRQQRGRGLRMA